MIVCLDFDGVIHSYESGWQGADTIPDPPVDGAISFLQSLIDESGIEPAIYSSRSGQPGGIDAMKGWLKEYGDGEMVEAIDWPQEKPPATVTIDDRAIRFAGIFPRIGVLREFKTWQESPNAYDKIKKERRKQDKKWGGPSHDDEHPLRFWAELLETQITQYRESVWTDDMSDAQHQLAQIAALAVAGWQAIERRKT